MRFWFYVMRASWRKGSGRWYVWRDVPTDVVRQVAVLWYHARKRSDEDTSVIREAYNEYQLRKRRADHATR